MWYCQKCPWLYCLKGEDNGARRGEEGKEGGGECRWGKENRRDKRERRAGRNLTNTALNAVGPHIFPNMAPTFVNPALCEASLNVKLSKCDSFTFSEAITY